MGYESLDINYIISGKSGKRYNDLSKRKYSNMAKVTTVTLPRPVCLVTAM